MEGLLDDGAPADPGVVAVVFEAFVRDVVGLEVRDEAARGVDDGAAVLIAPRDHEAHAVEVVGVGPAEERIVAAHALARGGLVIALDAGTTLTTEVVSAEPAYLGGAILPGPDLLRRSLARGTGQLPEVPWPDAVLPVGDSSVGAIQAGLGVLVVDGLTGLLHRTQAALGGGALVIATGGWGGWLAERIPEVDRVEPTLVLDGVRILSGSADR